MQLNIHMTPSFAEKLARFMKMRGIGTKSDAVRIALEEALENAEIKPRVGWQSLLGAGLHGELHPRDRWINEDDLWRDGTPVVRAADKEK